MEIETKRASLDTMAVTTQALHVDGRQMTLAVFRQLPEMLPEDLYWASRDNGGDADLWGIVRYAVGGESCWVVASLDGQMVRCGIGLAGGEDDSPWRRDCRAMPQLFIAV